MMFQNYLDTTRKHVHLLLYDDIEVVQRGQLSQKQSVTWGIQSKGIHHLQRHHMVLAVRHIKKTTKDFWVEMLKVPTRGVDNKNKIQIKYDVIIVSL